MGKKKTHKLLAFFSPVLCFIYVIVASFASGKTEEKLPGVSGIILGNLAAIAMVALLVLAYIAICKRYSLESRLDFKLTGREKRILLLLAMLVPLKFVLSHQLSLLILTKFMGLEYSSAVYTSMDFKEDLMALAHAAIVAPVLEEFAYRIIPISLCDRKVGKFLMLFATSILFGYSHGKNFWMTLIDGTIYGLIFLWTNRPIISIACHMAHNIFAFLIGVVAYFGGATFYRLPNRPSRVLIGTIPTIIFSLALVLVWILTFIITGKNKENTK